MRDLGYYPLIMMALVALILQVTSPAAANNVTFHFYGAEDCGACMAFKRDGLPVVERSATAKGFAVSANIIPKTRDVPAVGIFGEADPILRVAARQLDYVYPPIFFVTRGETVLSVHGHDWRAALRQAEIAAQATTN